MGAETRGQELHEDDAMAELKQHVRFQQSMLSMRASKVAIMESEAKNDRRELQDLD